MNLFLSAIALAATLSSAVAEGYKHARVVPDVLSKESIEKLHDHVGTFRLLRGDAGRNRHAGEVNVQANELRRILHSMETPPIPETEVQDYESLNSNPCSSPETRTRIRTSR